MIANQLQQIIESSGLSTYRIAKDADVHIAQLSLFRSAGRGLSLKSAGRVADVLHVKLVVDDESDATEGVQQ